jgi:hypothetical protein
MFFGFFHNLLRILEPISIPILRQLVMGFIFMYINQSLAPIMCKLLNFTVFVSMNSLFNVPHRVRIMVSFCFSVVLFVYNAYIFLPQ